jgi:transcriptional regulator with XRE-family HTH domain
MAITKDPTPLQKFIGERRSKMGITQAALATAIGIKVGEYISLVEKGKRRVPIARIPLLADALGVKRADLLKWALSEEEPLAYKILFPKDELLTPADAPEGFELSEGSDVVNKLNTLPPALRQSFIMMLDQAFLSQMTVNT